VFEPGLSRRIRFDFFYTNKTIANSASKSSNLYLMAVTDSPSLYLSSTA
jgi:hypothetical protein